jgi:threonine aldolase
MVDAIPISDDEIIDLRSDTVTRPSAAMRRAMAEAEVGDDVYGEDRSVIALEREVAHLAGKEAGLFFPSGTQSNLAALMAHCGRGDEYIVGQQAHTYRYEGGGAAVLGSIQPQPIENAEDGSLPLDKVRAAIKQVDFHFARTRLIALENTIAGKVLAAEYVTSAETLAREAGLGFHLDGARAWNAAIATGRPLSSICAPFDTVSLCLSKGLGAPVGSVLVGPRPLLEDAKRWRKVLGGGMRQSGLLAAAALYAVNHNLSRLEEDHANALYMAQELEALFGRDAIRYTGTNMVFVTEPKGLSLPQLSAHLAEQGIHVSGGTRIRLVTHLDVSQSQIGRFIAATKTFLRYHGLNE